MSAYLFVHFVGKEADALSEQVYFSVSRDGKAWELLNNSKPVLTSGIGDGGVRDPFIIKSVDGEKYYLIATDLSIYNRRADKNVWRSCQESGSRDIIVWESADMVNWSEPRAVRIAGEENGCAWAPEAMYDKEKEAYIVYFASTEAADGYKYQRMYRAYTKDFVTFEKAEKYIDNATEAEIEAGIAAANIDTTIIEENGVYYRFTKNETKSSVVMDKSTSLSRGWERVESYNLDEMTGYEGPTIFKLHGENKWCLLLDHFAAKKGYEPFITEDIAEGKFRSGGECSFSQIYRHGSVIPISDEEYNTLIAAYR